MSFGQKIGGFIQKVAPALGPIGAIGGAILQNRSNKKLAQYSFNKNVEMWKMQNAYNSPKQQMARYNQAGLNPNLIYGKGTAGNAQTMPQYQPLPNSGEVFGQSVAGLQGLVGIQQKKEDLAIAKISRHIADNTSGYKETVQMYQSMMAQTEYWQKELGFDTADQTIKIIAQSIIRENNGILGEADEKMLLDVIKGVSITKDIAKALTSLGFGALLGRSTKTGKQNVSGYTKTKKPQNFYPKGKGTTLNDMYRGPG
jgi:hypothetical protein